LNLLRKAGRVAANNYLRQIVGLTVSHLWIGMKTMMTTVLRRIVCIPAPSA
jgi:hypothetical protein